MNTIYLSHSDIEHFITLFNRRLLSRLLSRLPQSIHRPVLVVSKRPGTRSPPFPFLMEPQAQPTPMSGGNLSNRPSYIGLQHLKTHLERMQSWMILSQRHGKLSFPPSQMRWMVTVVMPLFMWYITFNCTFFYVIDAGIIGR